MGIENQTDNADTELDEDDYEIVIEGEDEEVADEKPEGETSEEETAEEGADLEEKPEGDEDDTDSEGGETDAAPEKFSKKVQKRIEREIRIRKRVEGERDQAVGAYNTVAQETVKLREQMANFSVQYAAVLEDALTTKIALKAIELRKAKDDAQVDDETRLEGELNDLRFKLSQVKDHAARLPRKPQGQQQQADQTQQQQAPTQQQQPRANPRASAWIERNKAWFNNPRFSTQREIALAIDEELDAEGYDKYSAEYFAELDKRLDAELPGFRTRKPKADAGGKKQPVAAAGSASSGSGKKPSNTITLTKADLADMASWGLDPSNKEHRKTYALQKRAVA